MELNLKSKTFKLFKLERTEIKIVKCILQIMVIYIFNLVLNNVLDNKII